MEVLKNGNKVILGDLELSDRTIFYLKKRYSSIAEMVWDARRMAYLRTIRSTLVEGGSKLVLELMEALDKAGYIRHDIVPKSFCVNRLYRDVYDLNPAIVPWNIEDFAMDQSGDTIAELGNERYEVFQNPTTGQLRAVTTALSAKLTEEEAALLLSYYGLDGDVYPIAECAKRFKMSYERANSVKQRALRKLKVRGLPAILGGFNQRPEVCKLIDELEDLYMDPVFQKAADLKKQLSEIAATPFLGANDARMYLNGTAWDMTSIEELGLDRRIYNSLMLAGIYTIADVLILPTKQWQELKYIGKTSREEIEKAMNVIGFTDFEIS